MKNKKRSLEILRMNLKISRMLYIPKGSHAEIQGADSRLGAHFNFFRPEPRTPSGRGQSIFFLLPVPFPFYLDSNKIW